MQYTLLGSTGVTVSRLCYGTMSFGGDADAQRDAERLIAEKKRKGYREVT